MMRAAGGGPHRGLITACIMLATVMQVLDTTIANVALPHMQGSLSATQDQISWVLTSYIVASAIMTPPTGYLARRFGRKQLFLFAVAGFVAASMLCGIAGSLVEIVIYRLLQGAFGASLVPIAQALLLDTYPRERHGWAMAMWGLGVMVGPILGPTLGGYLTDQYDWRWVFYINLPFGILAFLGILAFVPETPKDRTRGFDVFGFSMLSLAIGALQMMLDRGELKDWFGSPEIVAEAVLALLAFYLFLVHTFTAERPFIDLRALADRNLIMGVSLIFMTSTILLSTMALYPPFLQTLMGYPVLTAGTVLAPRGIGTMFAMFTVGRLIGRADPRLLALFGLAMCAFTLWLMTGFTAEVSQFTIVWTGVLQGFGLGFIFVPVSTMTFATLAAHQRTEAAGLFSLMRNVGGSLGISVMTAMLSHNQQVNHASLAQHVTPLNPMFREPYLPEAWSLETSQGLVQLNDEIGRQAMTIAYLDDFMLLMITALVAAPMLLLLRGPGRTAPALATASD